MPEVETRLVMYWTNLFPTTGDDFSRTFTVKTSGIFKHVSLVGSDFQNFDSNSGAIMA